MRRGEEGRALEGAAHRARVDGRERLAGEAVGQPAELGPTRVGEIDVRLAGETVLGRENRGAVADEEDTGRHEFSLSRKDS